MHPALEIFSQGEEIVTGQIVDSNAAWLSQQTVQLGFCVTRHTAVGDKLADLITLLQEISLRADCCICSGGLGPTSDDLTAQAVAIAFSLPLEFDAVAYEQIQQYFSNRNRVMPETNRKQAMLPQGALRLDNHWGTAPGFALRHNRCWFAFVPGVPSEMRQLYLEKIRPILLQRFDLKPKTLITIKTIGIGESDLQQHLNSIVIPDEVELGFRAGVGEVQTKLLFPAGYPEMAISALVNTVTDLIGDSVFAVEGLDEASGDLVAVIDRLMNTHKLTLSVVETASQGFLSSMNMGAVWLLESLYQSKINKLTERLGIEFITNDCINMAKAIAFAKQQNSDADLVLVQLCEDEQEKFRDPNQVITVNNVLLSKQGYYHSVDRVAGSAQRKQTQSSLLTLDLLRRYLQHKL